MPTALVRKALAAVFALLLIANWSPGIDAPAMEQVATTATDHLVKLMVVFLLQTVVVPIALVWAVYATPRAALSGASP